jgi:hypothetical protein
MFLSVEVMYTCFLRDILREKLKFCGKASSGFIHTFIRSGMSALNMNSRLSAITSTTTFYFMPQWSYVDVFAVLSGMFLAVFLAIVLTVFLAFHCFLMGGG